MHNVKFDDHGDFRAPKGCADHPGDDEDESRRSSECKA